MSLPWATTSSPTSYSYTIGPPPRPARRFTTSGTELVHLLVAFGVLTFDLVVIFPHPVGGSSSLVAAVSIAATAAFTGFIVHEVSHKISAQRRGYAAEFRMAPLGLLLSVVTAFFGFLMAAPGATMVSGMADVRDWGRTSLAGPASNLISGGLLFGAAFLVARSAVVPLAVPILLFLALINGYFAAFNLLPLGPLDGAKVLRWSTGVWGAAFSVSAAFAAGLFWLLYYGPPLP